MPFCPAHCFFSLIVFIFTVTYELINDDDDNDDDDDDDDELETVVLELRALVWKLSSRPKLSSDNDWLSCL